MLAGVGRDLATIYVEGFNLVFTQPDRRAKVEVVRVLITEKQSLILARCRQ